MYCSNSTITQQPITILFIVQPSCQVSNTEGNILEGHPSNIYKAIQPDPINSSSCEVFYLTSKFICTKYVQCNKCHAFTACTISHLIRKHYLTNKYQICKTRSISVIFIGFHMKYATHTREAIYQTQNMHYSLHSNSLHEQIFIFFNYFFQVLCVQAQIFPDALCANQQSPINDWVALAEWVASHRVV